MPALFRQASARIFILSSFAQVEQRGEGRERGREQDKLQLHSSRIDRIYSRDTAGLQQRPQLSRVAKTQSPSELTRKRFVRFALRCVFSLPCILYYSLLLLYGEQGIEFSVHLITKGIHAPNESHKGNVQHTFLRIL